MKGFSLDHLLRSSGAYISVVVAPRAVARGYSHEATFVAEFSVHLYRCDINDYLLLTVMIFAATKGIYLITLY